MKEKLKNKNILVICGGTGSEKEVSLRTGKAVYDSLINGGYTGAQMFILDKLNTKELHDLKPDVCFNAIHGKYGEDGVLQGYLEMLRIPYTGSGVYSSAVSFDKHTSKVLFDAYDIPNAAYYLDNGGGAQFLPCVVKPAREGSTVGISIVHTEDEYKAAVETARKFDKKVLVEKFITGKEFTMSVVEGKALPPIWIKPAGGFYDYESKYAKGRTEYLFDLGITEKEAGLVKKTAMDVYNVLECRGVARVDVIYADGIPFVLEINTMPGMTETSLIPKAAEKAGMSFLELVETMLMSALDEA